MASSEEHGPGGRWGGRLTQRPLPVQDPSILELSPADRKRLATIWHYRSATERRVADSFEEIARALERGGAPAFMIELARRAIDDEYRHTELSRVVASRFAGVELPPPERLPLSVPKHAGASPELRNDLFVVGQCVLNETTASTFLECCLDQAEGNLAEVALRELLSDEVEHGRLGFSFLASLDQARRRRIEPWLLPMAFTNLRLWRSETPDDPGHSRALSRHGAPPSDVIHEALVEALRGLIVPGLGELGMDTRALEAWLDKGAPTDRPPV
jgi:hypothetical protein